MRLMELWGTYLGPASDTLIDLGYGDRRWKNLYISGSINGASLINSVAFTASTLTVSTINGVDLLDFNFISAPSSPAYGNIWLDADRLEMVSFPNGNKEYIGGTLYASTTNAVISNTTAEKTLIGAGIGSLMLDTFYLVPGKTLRITASGLYGTQIVPVGLNVRVRMGTGGALDTTGGTIILDTGTQTPAGNLTNLWWRLYADITCRTDGASGTVMAQSTWEHQSAGVGNPINWEMINSSNVVIDTTINQTIQLTAQWAGGVAAADSMMCTNFLLETKC